MSKKLRTRSAIFVALLAAWGVSATALAVDEVEPNTPVTAAQPLVFGPDGTVTVYGRIGPASGGEQLDADLYTFQGNACDLVTIDIDGAMTADLMGLDANIALFGSDGSNPYAILDQDDTSSSVDPGSVDTNDPRIDNFKLPATGTYVVGVSGAPAIFVDVNTLSTSELGLNSNGPYTLIITRVPKPCNDISHINIEIKPGTKEVTPINPKAKGDIPVALLSSADFNAVEQVNPKTLTFGATGDEQSWLWCEKHGMDVNGDGRPDLVCHFQNANANFAVDSLEGRLKGKTNAGAAFEGKAYMKVVGGKLPPGLR